jgi:hypothetical protein
MDKKIYFRTLTDLNRYAAFLIKIVSKCSKFLERKRLVILRIGLKKWAVSCGVLIEGDLKSTHYLDYAEEPDPSDSMSPAALQEKAVATAQSVAEFFAVGVATDVVESVRAADIFSRTKQLEDNIGEFSYDNVFSQTYGFGSGAGPRTRIEVSGQEEVAPTVLDPRLPPTHPSVGIKLPKLPKLYEPATAAERVFLLDSLELCNISDLLSFSFRIVEDRD